MHRVLTARAARIMTVSNFSAGELERWYRVPRETIAVVPNAAEHIIAATNQPAILRWHRLAAKSYVLSLGTHCRAKNFAVVIEAMNRLPPPRPRLVVAGRMNANHFGTPAQWDAGAFVNVGSVSDGELRALYTNALCFVFPSVYEGFGIPPLEAMSCGCPAIVACAAALPETCGDAALYCDPGDPSDLAAKIDVLSQNQDLRTSSATAGIREITDIYLGRQRSSAHRSHPLRVAIRHSRTGRSRTGKGSGFSPQWCRKKSLWWETGRTCSNENDCVSTVLTDLAGLARAVWVPVS